MADEAAAVETEFDGTSFVPISGATESEEPSNSSEEVEETIDEVEEESDIQGSAEEEGTESEEKVSDEGDEESPDSEEDEAKALAEQIKAKRAGNAPKAIVGKAGDTEVQVTPDTMFEQKVDGKVEQVSMRQLLDGYASKQATHKQYRQFEQEKRTWESQRNEFNGVIDSFTKRVQGGEAIPAVMELIGASGANPLKTIRSLREALITDAQEFLRLTPEQRDRIYLEEEKTYLEQENKKLIGGEAQRRQRAQLEVQVEAVMSEYGIPDRDTFIEFVEHTKDYAKKYVGGTVNLQPEDVGKYYQAVSLKRTLDEALVESGLNAKVKEDSEEYKELADVVLKLKPSKDKIRYVLRELYKTDGSQNRRAKPGDKTSAKPGEKKANRADKRVDVDPGMDIDATPSLSNWRELLGVDE